MTERSIVAEQVGYAIRDRTLLRSIDLRVEPGEVVALVGPNGAGKSTLVRLLAGDASPSSGRILLDGTPVSRIRPRELALRRAVLPQQTVLQFAFTAREVVEMGRGLRSDRDDAIVTGSLSRTDSLHLSPRVYPSLSGGEQARVTLSRVLAQEAPVLLLDEPTASLDLHHQRLVMDVVRDLATAGAMVVAVLHDLNLAFSSADRIVVMHDGEVVADGSPWATAKESLLRDVFNCDITVMAHPHTGAPLLLPVSSPTTRSAAQRPNEPVATHARPTAGVPAATTS